MDVSTPLEAARWGGAVIPVTQEWGGGFIDVHLLSPWQPPSMVPSCPFAPPTPMLPPYAAGGEGRHPGETGLTLAFSCSSDFPALNPPASLSTVSSPRASALRASTQYQARGWISPMSIRPASVPPALSSGLYQPQ